MQPLRIDKSKGLWGGDLILFDSLPSTNQWVLDNASRCNHGDVVRAFLQTAGRGRFQRPWLAPRDRALAFTVALTSVSLKDATIPFLPQIAAIAVRETLAKHGIDALLKWPNDVMAAGKKISGVLAEQDTASKTIGLGIGINVNLTEDDFSQISLLQPATSMAILKKKQFNIEQVCSDLLSDLEKTINLVETRSPAAAVEIWEKHDFLQGRTIDVQTPTGTITGRYAGMDDHGRLRLMTPSGHEHLLWSGDVSLSIV